VTHRAYSRPVRIRENYRWPTSLPPRTVCAPGVVSICILGRNRIRIHADASYLITENSIRSDPDTDIYLRNRIIK